MHSHELVYFREVIHVHVSVTGVLITLRVIIFLIMTANDSETVSEVVYNVTMETGHESHMSHVSKL